MAKTFNQKIKILYLIQMLMLNTDEEHVLNMQEIIALLDEKGIKSERKSIYDDFETMRQFGIAVRFKKSNPSGYYLETREISLDDILIILKSIRRNQEVSIQQYESLVERISKFLSIYQKEKLQQIEAEENKKDEQAKAEQKMESAQVEVSQENQHTASVEKQKDDKKEEVQILFKEKHTNAIKVKFGNEINIKQHKESIYKVKVMTAVNPDFYGWVSSHGMGIKIVKPKAVAEEYRVYLKKLLKQYK